LSVRFFRYTSKRVEKSPRGRHIAGFAPRVARGFGIESVPEDSFRFWG
jgi:hypothetical protein